MIRRTLTATALLATLVTASHAAVTFSNFSFDATTFPAGPSVSGNALTWLPDNAFAGDGFTPTRTITFSYDVTSDQTLTTLNTTTQGFTFGTGTLGFTQTVFSGNTQIASGSISGTQLSPLALAITTPVSQARVVNTCTLTATDAAGFDLSSLSLVNQSVDTAPVPEPATIAAITLGAAGMIRRRNRR